MPHVVKPPGFSRLTAPRMPWLMGNRLDHPRHFAPMNLREFRQIARPHWFDILVAIKQSAGGLSVTQLSKKLKMSYMGVKQHCDELLKLGYLDTWRKPRGKGVGGRPEKLYRLTERGQDVFPRFDNEFTESLLSSLKLAYGSNSPEKLIFGYLDAKAEEYRSNVKGDTLRERLESLAKIRNREGYLCACDDAQGKLRLVDYHNPLEGILTKHPAALRAEQSAIEAALGCSVSRETDSEGLNGQPSAIFVPRRRASSPASSPRS